MLFPAVRNAPWVRKDFTLLQIQQCYSFKYCIIVLKSKVIHYRSIPLGAELPGPDPVKYLLLLFEHKWAVDFIHPVSSIA